MICRSPRWLLHDVNVWGKLHLGHLYMNRFAELMVRKPGAGLASNLLATLLTPLVCKATSEWRTTDTAHREGLR